jgi:hypothetical protein
MYLDAPVEILATAFNHAVLVGLSDYEYEEVDKNAFFRFPADERKQMEAQERQGQKVMPRKTLKRRPESHECRVIGMFPQGWANSTGGFGGVGGQMASETYTVVVEGPGEIAVYFSGGLAYKMKPDSQKPKHRQAFLEDLARCELADKISAASRYGAL